MLRWPDKVRRMRVVAPLAIFLYCYFWRLGVLDGIPGIVYTFRRMVADLLLSLYLFEDDFRD